MGPVSRQFVTVIDGVDRFEWEGVEGDEGVGSEGSEPVVELHGGDAEGIEGRVFFESVHCGVVEMPVIGVLEEGVFEGFLAIRELDLAHLGPSSRYRPVPPRAG